MGQTTIQLNSDIKNRLIKLKKKHGYKTMDETIFSLLEVIAKYKLDTELNILKEEKK